MIAWLQVADDGGEQRSHVATTNGSRRTSFSAAKLKKWQKESEIFGCTLKRKKIAGTRTSHFRLDKKGKRSNRVKKFAVLKAGVTAEHPRRCDWT